MLSTPPERPMVFLTGMLAASGVLRSTPLALVRPRVLVSPPTTPPTRPPSRSCDPGVGAARVEEPDGEAGDGAAAWSGLHAVANRTISEAAIRLPRRRRAVFMRWG